MTPQCARDAAIVGTYALWNIPTTSQAIVCHEQEQHCKTQTAPPYMFDRSVQQDWFG